MTTISENSFNDGQNGAKYKRRWYKWMANAMEFLIWHRSALKLHRMKEWNKTRYSVHMCIVFSFASNRGKIDELKTGLVAKKRMGLSTLLNKYQQQQQRISFSLSSHLTLPHIWRTASPLKNFGEQLSGEKKKERTPNDSRTAQHLTLRTICAALQKIEKRRQAAASAE